MGRGSLVREDGRTCATSHNTPQALVYGEYRLAITLRRLTFIFKQELRHDNLYRYRAECDGGWFTQE